MSSCIMPAIIIVFLIPHMSFHKQLQTLLKSAMFRVDRLICDTIEETLERKECVALLGPRQIGKTTLARSHFEKKLGGVYRDLELSEAQEEVGTGSKFFKRNKGRIIILDEIQERKILFPNIKVHVDEQRFVGNKKCKFLLLGSASLELQKKSVASLTGRVSQIQMTGILLTELINSLTNDIRKTVEQDLPESYKQLTDLLMFRGGMPLSLFAISDERSLREREEMVDSYVEHDIEKYGLNVDKLTLERGLDFIAKVNGSQFEISTYTKHLKTDRQRVHDLISALSQLLLLRVIDPWSEFNGRTVKVTKHTKVYIRDSGLLAYLLKIDDTPSLLTSNRIGSVWESFVIESLIGTAQSIGVYRNCYYYRTHKGESELDFILEFRDGTKWGIEIKHSEPENLNSGNITAATTVGVQRRLVIHNGTNSYEITGGFEAMPLHEALDEILEKRSH